MKKKYLVTWVVLMVAMALSFSGCSGGIEQKTTGESSTADTVEVEQTASLPSETESLASQKDDKAVDYVDDFYNAVNHDLLDSWEIPANAAQMGWFWVLNEENYKKLDGIIQQVSSETNHEKGSDMYNIRAVYLTGLDQETRDREGYGEKVKALLKEVDESGTVDELLKASLQFQRDYRHRSLMGFTYKGDEQDSSKKVLYLNLPEIGLVREDWFSQDPDAIKRVEAYKKFLIKLNEIRGMSSDEAEAVVEQVTEMMKDLASSSLYMEEQFDAKKTYHVYTVKDVPSVYESAIPFTMLEEIYGCRADEKVVITQPDLCKKLGTYLTEDNLPLLKNYVKTCLYEDFSSCADIESLNARLEYAMAVNGTEEKEEFERLVSEETQNILDYECGKLFCEKYFDEDAKKNVTDMIQQIIDVYDQRLANLEWMSENTRQEARKKLAAISVKVGYPDSWPQDNYDLILKAPEEGGVYIDNILMLNKAKQDFSFRTKNDPVDSTEWDMAPQIINASYSSDNNDITFPAGILQPPFYDPEAQPVTNLGRIGMVIGHEITHAFDSSGSQYDENGNLRNWWSEEDKQKFDELTQKVIDYYNSMEVNGIQVNGSLSVTENIADLGAISCITEIAKKQGYDLKELYKAYAVIWASKSRDEFLSYIMTNDTHAPDIIRINAVLSTIEDFYTAFDVKEGDGMYQKPENRPKIW